MSLFGALSSGVSGLTAQSSAMGAISDNITNVSTIGYKNTTVNFQSLVTKQTSSTFYSAGGVQSRPERAAGPDEEGTGEGLRPDREKDGSRGPGLCTETGFGARTYTVDAGQR